MTFTFAFKLRAGSIAAIATLLLSAPAGRAQLPGGLGNALGGLSGGMPSVTQAAPANIAGVLQYCVQNNYLSGGVAGPAKDALMSKVPGAAQSSGFKTGSSGLLDTGKGQSFNLAGGGSGGITSEVTHQVCDMVLQHAKSLL